VLHQQGGWWCWDEYSCRVRFFFNATPTTEKRTLMSSTPLAALTQLHDTFNGEKNTGIMTHNASVRNPPSSPPPPPPPPPHERVMFEDMFEVTLRCGLFC